MAEPLGIVEVFVSRQAAVDGLPKQISQTKLGILSLGGAGQVLFDQLSEPESLVEFPHHDQAAVRGDAGTLEIDSEGGVEGELKGLILCLTRGVLTSGEPSSRSHPHSY